MFEAGPFSTVAPPPPLPPPGLLASIPAGTMAQEFNQSGFVEANGDGSNGFNANNTWTILQTWVFFPAPDQYYQFVVPCYCTGGFSGLPANAIQVMVDMLPIPSDLGTAVNLNWFCQFVSNAAPSQGSRGSTYSFTAPVKAGWHSVQLFCSHAAASSYLLNSTPNTPTHMDRLNVFATGTPLPTEPAGNRDPGRFPCSSYHFINTPFGVGAQWMAFNNPIAQSINGTGGNGAFVSVKQTNGAFFWTGKATDPVFTVTSGQTINLPTPSVNLPYPVRAPAGLYPAFGGPTDRAQAIIDGTNPRYMYAGFVASVTGRNAPFGSMAPLDSYNLNGASPQQFGLAQGSIRVADLDAGVIAHRLTGGLGFAAVIGPGAASGYGPAAQTSQWSGQPWPSCESDGTWKQSNEYTNPNGVPYGSVIGIPPSEVKPGGLSTITSMLWDCLQNYGLYLNVTASTYPQITILAEGATGGHPLDPANVTWSAIVPHLSVMTNAAPIVINPANPQGFGGGALRPGTALLSGVQQGYPDLGLPPFNFPASPVGIPIQLSGAVPGSSVSTGAAAAATSSVNTTIPTGSMVIVALSFDRSNPNISFSSLSDSAGNNYTTIIQPPSSPSNWHPTLAVCLSTTAPIGNGVTWTANLSAGGQVNYFFMGAYYRPAPPSGSPSLRVSNSAATASSVTTLSTTLAGVQVGDLVIGYTQTSGFAEIVSPGSMGELVNIGFTSPAGTVAFVISFQIAQSAGTFTYNPTWNIASGAGLCAAAFANTNIAT